MSERDGRTFTADQLAERSGLPLYFVALEVLEGPGGFVQKGLVVRAPGGYRLTETGRELSAALDGARG